MALLSLGSTTMLLFTSVLLLLLCLAAALLKTSARCGHLSLLLPCNLFCSCLSLPFLSRSWEMSPNWWGIYLFIYLFIISMLLQFHEGCQEGKELIHSKVWGKLESHHQNKRHFSSCCSGPVFLIILRQTQCIDNRKITWTFFSFFKYALFKANKKVWKTHSVSFFLCSQESTVSFPSFWMNLALMKVVNYEYWWEWVVLALGSPCLLLVSRDICLLQPDFSVSCGLGPHAGKCDWEHVLNRSVSFVP